ncbi:MAG: PorV/PorQ family protein [Elusimicrobia bacterium]|nr:PorV/PorQ family protein [Elusimicrobiota bacterium]
MAACLASSAHAKGPGTSAAPFLTISFGSRAQSLGNSFVAIADDASATYFNPAGLVQGRGAERQRGGGTQKNYEFQASRSAWFQDIAINQMALANFRPGQTSWGISMTGLAIEGLEQRTGETEKPDGYFKAEDISLGLSLARRVGRGPLSLGMTTKIVQQRISNVQGNTVALDLGSMMKFKFLRQNFSAGLGVRNLGPKLNFGREAFPLPLTYHAGLAYQGLIVQVLEFAFNRDGLANVSFGTEYWFLGVFSIRGGYLRSLALRNGERAGARGNSVAGITVKQGITGGFGIKVMNTFGMDYAFVPFGDLGAAQRLTMSYKF